MVQALGRRLPDATGATRLRRTVALAAVGVIAVGGLAIGTQRAGYLRDAIEKAGKSYALTDDSPLVTTDEYALIMRVPSHVPAGGVVATNPWNGSSMLYPLTGIATTTTHVLYTPTAGQTAVRVSLDELASSPEACAAAMELGVTHALDFGTQEVHHGSNPYPGFDELASAEGFRLVDREGSAALYELTLCRR